MTLEGKILEEFEEKYRSFELCDSVNNGDRERLKDFLTSAMKQVREEEVEITKNAILQAKEGWIEEGRVSCPPHDMIPITKRFSWSSTAPAPTHKCTKCLLTESF